MFDIKCSRCQFFSMEDLCEKGLSEECCDSFLAVENSQTDNPSCSECEWFLDNDCIFDLKDSLSCRRFKAK